VSFTIGAAASTSAPALIPSKTASTSASKPDQEPTPTPTAPQPVTVTVSNLVTNGTKHMREDTPAYLSTRTVGFCRKHGCKLDGTEMSSGFVARAVCRVVGDHITNGQDDNAIDDGNPGLHSSTLWYRIRWADGREGNTDVMLPAPRHDAEQVLHRSAWRRRHQHRARACHLRWHAYPDATP
jgi:hypothetical protein